MTDDKYSPQRRYAVKFLYPDSSAIGTYLVLNQTRRKVLNAGIFIVDGECLEALDKAKV